MEIIEISHAIIKLWANEYRLVTDHPCRQLLCCKGNTRYRQRRWPVSMYQRKGDI